MSAMLTMHASTAVSSLGKASRTPGVSSSPRFSAPSCQSGTQRQSVFFGALLPEGRLKAARTPASNSPRKHLCLPVVIVSRVGERGDGWIAENDAVARSMPLLLGSFTLVAVLLNRSFSGIAPIAEASSAQSRSDVLALALAATVLLQGLVWKSIQPKPVISVEMEGVECFNMAPSLPGDAVEELQWVWEAVRSATRSQALVVVYGAACVMQAGLAADLGDGSAVPVNAPELLSGPLCKGVQKSGIQNYLANLALYPGRFELPFLPSNAQAVIIQPLGDDGVLIVASDTIRGFTARDQAWLGTIGEKLDTTLSNLAASCAATAE